MRKLPKHDAIRRAARTYEQALPAQQRKQLGQFFTGIPLGKILAHLALEPGTRAVLDPMAGHGDLLDATGEAAAERGIILDQLDGIEFDAKTAKWGNKRLSVVSEKWNLKSQKIIHGSAFDNDVLDRLPCTSYDLVITNPPYVRYQALDGRGHKDIRHSLCEIIKRRLPDDAGEIWHVLASQYSGLADLSIPSWLLASSLVKPGGRLALVVPASWRSRNYADVIRYLLLRCFALEYIVEDTQPGWFSDALVRTQLVVARRLSTIEESVDINSRKKWTSAALLKISPIAANELSLVGAAFPQKNPEASFANWVCVENQKSGAGLDRQTLNLEYEWADLKVRTQQKKWFKELEVSSQTSPSAKSNSFAPSSSIPEKLREIVKNVDHEKLTTSDKVGINISQGLRTGCNRFFYVTAIESKNSIVKVKTSPDFAEEEFWVPAAALRPVLRKQSELLFMEKGRTPPGRVLDLRQWILPEDMDLVSQSKNAYKLLKKDMPQVMPETLADFVRKASRLALDKAHADKYIPDLSAVHTNIRIPQNERSIPRFWYMLPDFTARHLPMAFVARINHDIPWVEVNLDSPNLIDANFSTLWATNDQWRRYAIKALFNSSWCRACMEALGTHLGGGALKLEATHLRQLPVPILDDNTRAHLEILGQKLTHNSAEVLRQIDSLIFKNVAVTNKNTNKVIWLSDKFIKHSEGMRDERRRSIS